MKKGYFSKLPKDKLQKIVLICIVMLVAFVGVVEFYALNNWNALADTKKQIAKLDDQVRQAEAKAREASQDVARRTELKSFVETQRATMVSGDPFAWVVREMSLLAEHEPVHVSGLHPGAKVETKAGVTSYAARIDFSGTYDEIGTYVRDLENRFPTAEIQSLSVTGGADDQGRHGAVVEIALGVQPTHAAQKAEGKKVS